MTRNIDHPLRDALCDLVAAAQQGTYDNLTVDEHVELILARVTARHAKPDAHPCPTPKVGAGHNKPPSGWVEGAVFGCECGELYALRNRWNYAGNWWDWERLPRRGGGD